MPDQELSKLLQNVCHNLMAERDWRLLDTPGVGVTREEMAERVADVLLEWLGPDGLGDLNEKLVERACVHAYCHLLYDALGARDQRVQQRACLELWRYVTPAISRIVHDRELAEECAQETLCEVIAHRAEVKEPGTLLFYATKIAYRKALRALRHGDREPNFTSLIEAYAAEDEELDALEHRLDELIERRGRSPLDEVEDREALEAWAEQVRRCLQKWPARAEVFIALVLGEQTVRDIARALQVKPNHVHQLKFRAIQGLRRCPELRDRLRRGL